MVPLMDFIWVIYSPQKFDGDIVKGRKIRWENPQKFTHKLNKQQIEQWHHLANLSELFLPKSFYGNNVTDRR